MLLALMYCFPFRFSSCVMLLWLLLRSVVLLLLTHAASAEDAWSVRNSQEYADQDPGPSFVTGPQIIRQARSNDLPNQAVLLDSVEPGYWDISRQKREVDSPQSEQNVTETIDHNSESDVAQKNASVNPVESDAINQDERNNNSASAGIDGSLKEEQGVSDSDWSENDAAPSATYDDAWPTVEDAKGKKPREKPQDKKIEQSAQDKHEGEKGEEDNISGSGVSEEEEKEEREVEEQQSEQTSEDRADLGETTEPTADVDEGSVRDQETLERRQTVRK